MGTVANGYGNTGIWNVAGMDMFISKTVHQQCFNLQTVKSHWVRHVTSAEWTIHLPALYDSWHTGFLQNELPALLENVALWTQLQTYYKHNEVPPHFTRSVVQYLNELLTDWWLGHDSPQNWPLQSPDFSLLDFHVWSKMKNLAHKCMVDTRDELPQQIFNAA